MPYFRLAPSMCALLMRTAFVAPTSTITTATTPLAVAARHSCSCSFLSSSALPRSSLLPIAPVPTRTLRRARTFPSPASSQHTRPIVMTSVASAPAKQPPVKYLKDYSPPPFFIRQTNLAFSLDDDGLDVTVRANLTVTRAANTAPSVPLTLDGEGLDLLPGLRVADVELPTDQFKHDTENNTLTIAAAALPSADEFVVETAVRIRPAKNTALDGLYMTAGDYCTQCEPEGFRRITFFIDRPDVMSKFDVRIEADKARYPVLLSNGNRVEEGDTADGRHWARFEDPFPKPSYLFALVAGDLAHLHDTFTTVGGRKVDLRVFVKGESEVAKCAHAMRSLKRAMKWDEDVYGLEYNFDIFNIVAVPSFVFGAMENTSLNIFNSKYVLVSPETATDTDFNNVEGVVAHEYFHNYSGNRVTVSSWFQLSLKEGLTVFRDQSFSADMNSATVTRIGDVAFLRSAQFSEDAGPMAHPIRPESYITCNTFYTSTVYEKGAEVIRMLKTIVGEEGYRRGTDIYFSRNDGKAVTCEDWVQAVQDANPQVDLSVFRRWYKYSGTPIVTVDVQYDAAQRTMTLACHQSIKPTAKQPSAEPLFIPLRVGLIAPDGSEVSVDLGDGSEAAMSKTLNFVEREQSFVLRNVPDGTVPSLLRGFSAPVKLVRTGGVSTEEYAFLMANDSDEFNRYESAQKIALGYVLDFLKTEDGDVPPVSDLIVDAFRTTLMNNAIDGSLRAQVFTLPSETYVTEQVDVADPVRIRVALNRLRRELAEQLEDDLKNIVEIGLADSGEYKLDPKSQGKRALKNVALIYLASLENKETYEKCLDIVRGGANMTDVLAALNSLASTTCAERDIALDEFFTKWESDYLVTDKWLRIQSTCKREDVLDIVKALTQHKAYRDSVPNSVYALIGGYAGVNMHIPSDGSGYEFMADQVIRLDRLNPQVAARIARPFTRWRKYDTGRQALMEPQLRRIIETEKLSKDVFEVINSCLE